MPKKRARNGRRSRKNGRRGIRGGFGGIAAIKWRESRQEFAKKTFHFFFVWRRIWEQKCPCSFKKLLFVMNSFFFKWFPGDVGDIQIIFGRSNKDTGFLRSSHQFHIRMHQKIIFAPVEFQAFFPPIFLKKEKATCACNKNLQSYQIRWCTERRFPKKSFSLRFINSAGSPKRLSSFESGPRCFGTKGGDRFGR